MADGKKRNSMTTLGLSMLRFGRKLMRVYETPTSQHVQPSTPYQSMATPSLNWDNVVPSTPNTEPPLPEESEMLYEEFDPFAPSNFQTQHPTQQPRSAQPRQQRPVQRRQQPPAQPPIQRNAQPRKNSGLDPRLQRVLDFHKQREADREVTRQERRRQWEETKGQDQVAPDIPGWKPKKRAAFDYIETSSLTKGADTPSQTSETKSKPVQRKAEEEPERSVRSQVSEQSEMSDTNDDELDFDDGFIAANEPSFDDFDDYDINLGTDNMDTVPMKPIVPSSSDSVQRQADIQPEQQETSNVIQDIDSITDEQIDSFSQSSDNKQVNQPRHQAPVERPQNHRIQRRSSEPSQTPEQSHETQDSDSSEYDADDDISDSFQVAPTANKSSPIQRKRDENQNIPDISDDFSETDWDDSPSENDLEHRGIDTSTRTEAQPPIQRFAEDSDWEGSDDDYGVEDYPSDPRGSQQQTSEPPIQRFAEDSDWEGSDDGYGVEDYPSDPRGSQQQTSEPPIQRFAEDSDWEGSDDGYGVEDYPSDPRGSQQQTSEPPIQRFAEDSDWEAPDDDYGSEDYPSHTDVSQQSTSHPPVQRFAEDSDWEAPDDDYGVEDYPSDPRGSQQQTSEPPIQRFAEDSDWEAQGDDHQAISQIEHPSSPQKPIAQRRADETSDSEAMGESDNANDFPIVQRSIGADGKLYYNVVEDDDLSGFEEQDTDVYQAMIDAGLVQNNTPHETSQRRDNSPTNQAQQGQSQPSVQRHVDESQTMADSQFDDISPDNEADYPTVQRQMGADGQMYYNLAEDDTDSLPEQPMDIYQALMQSGMLSSENAPASDSSGSPSDAIQRTTDSPLSSIGIPQDVQDAMLQRLREKNEQVRETGQIPDIENQQPSQSKQPPIQRTYSANVQRKPPIPDTIMRDDDIEVESANGTEDNIDKLARDVYKLLRRRLRDEAERRNRK